MKSNFFLFSSWWIAISILFVHFDSTNLFDIIQDVSTFHSGISNILMQKSLHIFALCDLTRFHSVSDHLQFSCSSKKKIKISSGSSCKNSESHEKSKHKLMQSHIQRINMRKETSKNNAIISYDMLDLWLDTLGAYSWSNPIVVEKHKLVLFTIPKVACTVMRTLARRLMGIESWAESSESNGNFPEIHAPKRNGLRYLTDYPRDRAREIMLSTDWHALVMLREPLGRILSAYLNKCVRDLEQAYCSKPPPTLGEWIHGRVITSIDHYNNFMNLNAVAIEKRLFATSKKDVLGTAPSTRITGRSGQLVGRNTTIRSLAMAETEDQDHDDENPYDLLTDHHTLEEFFIKPSSTKNATRLWSTNDARSIEQEEILQDRLDYSTKNRNVKSRLLFGSELLKDFVAFFGGFFRTEKYNDNENSSKTTIKESNLTFKTLLAEEQIPPDRGDGQAEHWRPQSHFVPFDILRREFNKCADETKGISFFVAHLDTAAEDMECFLRKLGLWEEMGATGWGKDGQLAIFAKKTKNIMITSENASKKVDDYWTDDLRREISQAGYDDDIQLYAFTKLNKHKCSTGKSGKSAP